MPPVVVPVTALPVTAPPPNGAPQRGQLDTAGPVYWARPRTSWPTGRVLAGQHPGPASPMRGVETASVSRTKMAPFGTVGPMGADQESNDEKAVHNELNGHVTGPVGQFGAVYGDVHLRGPAETPLDAERQARYWARLEEQWAREDAARTAEQERAQRLQRAQEEAPAIRWRNENAAWRKKLAVERTWTLVLLGISIPSFIAFAAVEEESGARGWLATGGLLMPPGFMCLVAYLTTSVRYHLWRGW